MAGCVYFSGRNQRSILSEEIVEDRFFRVNEFSLGFHPTRKRQKTADDTLGWVGGVGSAFYSYLFSEGSLFNVFRLFSACRLIRSVFFVI